MLKNFRNLISITSLAVLTACGSQSNIEDSLLQSKNEKTFLELVEKIKKTAELNNESYSKCGACKGKTLFVTDLQMSKSSTVFKGENEKRETLKGSGVEISAKNIKFLEDGKLEINFGFQNIVLSELEQDFVKYAVYGTFIESHWRNNDIEGIVVSVEIDQSALAQAEERRKSALAQAEERRKVEDAQQQLFSNILDGRHNYYSEGNKDNSINLSEYEILCKKAGSAGKQAMKMHVLIQGSLWMQIINNSGDSSINFKRLSWNNDSCSIVYNVSGLHSGTSYNRDFYARAVSFIKDNNSVRIVHMF